MPREGREAVDGCRLQGAEQVKGEDLRRAG